MDMLDYCKTYSMVKSSYTNQESADPNLQDAGRQTTAQQKHDGNGDCVVETIQSLSITPADNLSLYNSVTQTQKELYQVGENKLIPLKEIGRHRGIATSMNARSHQRTSFDSELTFAPKLNALSIKLAKERGEKMTERRNTGSSIRTESDFTFKPKVSSNSVKIMQQLKTTFMDRQQLHVEKQKRYIEATINSYHTRGKCSPVPPVKSPTRMKKVPKIKEAPCNREVTLNEGQQLLPGKVTLQRSFESMSAPDLCTTPNSVLKQSADDPAATNSSSSCNVTDSLNQSNSEHNLTSSSSSDLTKKTCSITMTNKSSNSKDNLTSSSSTTLAKKPSKVKFAEKVPSKSDEACKKMLETSPYNQSTENLYLRKHVVKRSVVKGHKRSLTHPLQKSGNNEKNESSWDDNTKIEDGKKSKVSHSRSQSQPFGYNSQPAGKLKYEDPLFDKVRQAKCAAEAAIKQKRVFICHGPYPIVRATLRKRGWVEKHYRENLLIPKNKKNDSDDSGDDSCDSDNDSDNQNSNSSNQSPHSKETNSKVSSRKLAANKTRKLSVTGSKADKNKEDNDDSGSDDHSDNENFDEEDWNAGYEGKGADFEFSLMSRCVRNSVASFIWTTKRDDVDFKFLRKDQIVNHYCKAYSFTTKIGLSTNLRNLKWYEEADHLTFFPRSHLLGSDEEKLDFIDDYRLTAAISIVKWVTERYANGCPSDEEPSNSQTKEEPASSNQSQDHPKTESSNSQPSAKSRAASRRSSNVVPLKALTLSLKACQEYLRSREHLDIDEDASKWQVLTEDSWNLLVDYYYQVKMHGAVITSAYPYLKECQNTLKQMRDHLPQLEIDGTKNIWIVKPGAKSRGRGIMCMDRLDDILKLIGTTIGKKEGRLVVQKYIERPLLIHGVKFDIRQWFLVTDWNPLTMWFYQDCYLRFCTQIFSLDDFHISIHLANNSIQKHFENNGMRDKRLPDENMWSSDSFKEYLKKRGVGRMWDEVIYPGMKKAVTYALQSCQEIVEYRKNSFELYGADFIISEDYKPWLLEINCSPTMGPSTAVTKKLCAQVLEDTMKVVLDRREDKNCDTGRYELAFKQPQVTSPPYIGINMAVEGQAIRKAPVQVKRQRDVTSEAPRVAPSPRPKDSASENVAAKIAALARPKETRNAMLNCSDSLESNGSKRQSESKGKSNTRKPEGSWAMGCLCAAQPIPVATTFCTTDDGKLKGYIARARGGYSPEVDVSPDLQQRGQRQMKIPTAVLKYSSNASLRTTSQLPISIGPDNSVKHY